MTATEHRNLGIGIRTQLSCDPDGFCRLFQNPVGKGVMGKAEWKGKTATVSHARMVTFGLAPGSSDQVGWCSVVITPEMIGQRFARFVALEDKTGCGRARGTQSRFIEMVRKAGGIAGVVRSIEDARNLLIEHGADPQLFTKENKT